METIEIRLYDSSRETEMLSDNEAAVRLYHKLGFTNLNTLTLNRSVKEKRQLGTETIGGLTFRTYRPNNG